MTLITIQSAIIQTSDTELLEHCSRCVKCGQCLPTCPTFALYNSEAFSPRGRISIIQELVRGSIEVDETLATRLDTCVRCRRCEAVCPSQVAYGTIIDLAMARLQNQLSISRNFTVRSISHGLLDWSPASFFSPNLSGWHKSDKPPVGQVLIFAGCTGTNLDRSTLEALLMLLKRANFDVYVPEQEHCCGALAKHNGQIALAEELLGSVNALLAKHEFDAVLGLNPACTAQLAEAFPSSKITEAISFVAQHSSRLEGQFGTSADSRVGVHQPCLSVNAQQTGTDVFSALELIPQVELTAIGDPGQCCGAGGLHYLSYPEAAAKMRQPLVDQCRNLGVRTLVSSSLGCIRHLQAGLKSDKTRVIHPLTFLAEHLLP